MPSNCRGCGRELVTIVGSSQCVFCGRKKRVFQSASTPLTRRGLEKKMRQVVVASTTASGLMTWQEAEINCLDWMKRNGFRDAKLTRRGADGGLDIVSKKAVAQVKHHQKPVSISDIQRHYGIAQSAGKQALFFSTGGYTRAAITWAHTHGVICYRIPSFSRVKA